MYGIDVYEGDGSVDWTAVRNSGKTFAFVRATEGLTITDQAFDHHWPVMKMDGIIRGAYHFFHPHTSPPVEQAQHFLNTVKLEPGDLPPVLDVEVSDDVDDIDFIISGIRQWLNEVESGIKQRTGKNIKPIIYTFPNFWIDTLGNPSDFAEYPLWVAHFGVDTPYVPSSWGTGNWLIHQYQGDVDNVAGVSGSSDLDKFNLFQEGSTGLNVKEIQQLLKNLKKPEFDPGAVNGVFNAQTQKAVIAFQKSKKLQADGIIGPKTWVSLIWA